MIESVSMEVCPEPCTILEFHSLFSKDVLQMTVSPWGIRAVRVRV